MYPTLKFRPYVANESVNWTGPSLLSISPFLGSGNWGECMFKTFHLPTKCRRTKKGIKCFTKLFKANQPKRWVAILLLSVSFAHLLWITPPHTHTCTPKSTNQPFLPFFYPNCKEIPLKDPIVSIFVFMLSAFDSILFWTPTSLHIIDAWRLRKGLVVLVQNK